jgi:dipeptidyl aminopeptidase/acylaminoacyl peptidase
MPDATPVSSKTGVPGRNPIHPKNWHFPAGALTAALVLALLAACSTSEPAATGPSGAAPGDGRVVVTEADYSRAESLLSWNLQDKVLRSDIRPNWIDDDRFWYRVRTSNGFRFYRVDPDARERSHAFNHERLAGALGEAAGRTISPDDLTFTTFRYIHDETAILFRAHEKNWECDLGEYVCRESERPEQPANSVLSPDGRWAAFIRDHNLWVRDMEGGEEFALTTGGTERHGFATNSQGWFRSATPVLHWSPDSRKIATYRLDERGVRELHLLETAQDRPILDSWPYALPGDSIVPMHERVILDVESRAKIWLDIEPSHQRTSNCCGLERGDQWADIEWSADASKLAFVTTSRDYREVNLYTADTETGNVRHVYRETAATFFESNLTSRGVPNWRVLFERDEFIWFSRRDEWGHLYLHRLDDGRMLRRITDGSWNVVDVLHVDEQEGRVWFTAAGREEDRDPYLEHLYRVDFGKPGTAAVSDDGDTGESAGRTDQTESRLRDPDRSAERAAERVEEDTRDGIRRPEGITGTYGTSAVRDTIEIKLGNGHPVIDKPVLLSPQNANHEVAASPSGRFFVDEYSDFRTPSVTVLRNASGEEVMTLEEADVRPLKETPWVEPEPFTVKARDGETDLYGLIYKPSHFDPGKSYPVVVNIYPGPQIGSVGTRSFSPVRRGQTHALAELGFIVIQLDALGTPLRSKSFHTAWYGDMSDNGIEDQIAGVRQLAERFPWIDAGRAGMYGHSGGGYATMSALLRFPGVFKAGVASAGNMDNRGYTYYWGEKYQGPRIMEDGADTYSDQAIWKDAGQLQDHLLLTYGTMDSNVHPNTTLLLIDELIRENKDFDLIVMPNRGHGYANEHYHLRRTFDFFVRHLLDADPPREYRMAR